MVVCAVTEPSEHVCPAIRTQTDVPVGPKLEPLMVICPPVVGAVVDDTSMGAEL